MKIKLTVDAVNAYKTYDFAEGEGNDGKIVALESQYRDTDQISNLIHTVSQSNIHLRRLQIPTGMEMK